MTQQTLCTMRLRKQGKGMQMRSLKIQKKYMSNHLHMTDKTTDTLMVRGGEVLSRAGWSASQA